MSLYGRTYVANIAPVCESWQDAIRHGVDVLRPGGELRREAFAPKAFRRFEPGKVPVVLSHEKNRHAGRVTEVLRHRDWFIASFVLDHAQPLSAVALDRLRIGAAVSISFASLGRDNLLAEDGVDLYRDVLLRELSVLGPDERPAYPGAQVTQIIEGKSWWERGSTVASEVAGRVVGDELARQWQREAPPGRIRRVGVGQVLRVR